MAGVRERRIAAGGTLRDITNRASQGERSGAVRGSENSESAARNRGSGTHRRTVHGARRIARIPPGLLPGLLVVRRGETLLIASSCTPRRPRKFSSLVVHVSAARHHAERRAGKGTPTSGQFSRWGPAQPAEGGQREGSHPGPVGVCAAAALRAAVPAPTGRTGQRSAFPEPSPRFNADRRYAVRSSEIRGAQRCWCGFRAPARCRSETGAPCPRDSARGGVLTSAKTMAANFVRCQRDRGESVKGGLPPSLSQINNDQSELAAARRRRAREFRLPARSAGRSGDGGLPVPICVIGTHWEKCPHPRTARP